MPKKENINQQRKTNNKHEANSDVDDIKVKFLAVTKMGQKILKKDVWGERGSNSRPQDNSEAMRPTR